MNFACDACQKRYSIADDKVQGRGFRVTCKQCGHVIVVRASPGTAPRPAVQGPRPAPPAAGPLPAAPPMARPPPGPAAVAAPAGPSPAPLEPRLPGDPPPAEHHDEHEHFFSSEPTHRPRVTAEWLLQTRRRRPTLLVTALGLVALLAAGGVALSLSQRPARPADPPPAPLAGRRAAAPAPAPAVRPALSVKGAAPESGPMPELPPEQPLAQRGATPPRGVGGQAGFEPVGGGGDDDPRARLRQRDLRIARKDRRLLDLLDKKQDAAPGAVARAELDTGRGSLDAAAVRRALAANANGFAACVTRAVKADPGLKVNDRRATLNLTIKPSGVVSSAWISEADLDKSPLGLCLLGTARRMIFPAFSGEEVDVAAPLALSTSY